MGVVAVAVGGKGGKRRSRDESLFEDTQMDTMQDTRDEELGSANRDMWVTQEHLVEGEPKVSQGSFGRV